MSVLFPKLNKPRQWDYRPIYYDPEKEERKEKLAKLQAEREKKEQEGSAQDAEKPTYQTTLHRGSFREARGDGHKRMDEARSKSRLWFWLALLGMLALFVYIISTKNTL